MTGNEVMCVCVCVTPPSAADRQRGHDMIRHDTTSKDSVQHKPGKGRASQTTDGVQHKKS